MIARTRHSVTLYLYCLSGLQYRQNLQLSILFILLVCTSKLCHANFTENQKVYWLTPNRILHAVILLNVLKNSSKIIYKELK
jgi:hypothetical protein